MLAVRGYARVFHRLRVKAAERIPATRSPGPLIVVANHASGADPLLIQAACPFEITWIMGADMAHPWLGALWRSAGVITVDRKNASGFPLREALRALRDGRVLGIFPEGRIARPARRLQPFHPGASLLIERSGAPVLPFLITGAPTSANAWTDLLTTSRAVVRPLGEPAAPPRAGSREHATALREVFRRESGWPLAEEA